MAIYKVKRYSNAMISLLPLLESHALRNTLIGVGSTAAALYGAKRGVFGNSLMRSVNSGYAKVGKAIGSESMIASGAKGFGLALANIAESAIKTALASGKNVGANFNRDAFAAKSEQGFIDRLNGLYGKMNQEQVNAAIKAKTFTTPLASSTPAAPTAPAAPTKPAGTFLNKQSADLVNRDEYASMGKGYASLEKGYEGRLLYMKGDNMYVKDRGLFILVNNSYSDKYNKIYRIKLFNN